MALFNGWPWAQFQEQNLDWIIKKLKELENSEIDYQQFKTEVTDFMADLNLPEEVQRQIQVLLDNGTIENIISDLSIDVLFNSIYRTPDQYKTDSNTWDDAFTLMAKDSGSKNIAIPDNSYNLTRNVYVDDLVTDAGIYPGGKIIAPEDVSVGEFEHLRSINKWGSTDYLAQGCTIHGTIFAYISNDASTQNTYINEYQLSDMSIIRRLEVGTTTAVHGNSIAWDPFNNRYLVAPSNGIGTIYAVDQLGNVSTLSLNTGDVVDVILTIEDGFLIGRHNVSLFQCTPALDIVREYKINPIPELPNNNTYTAYQNIAYYKGKLYYMVSQFSPSTNSAGGFAIWESPVSNINWKLFKAYNYSEHFHGEEAEGLVLLDDKLYVLSYCRNYTHLLCFDDDISLNDDSGQNYTIYVDESRTADGTGTSQSPFNSLDEALFYGRKGYLVNASNASFPYDYLLVNYKGRIYGTNLKLSGVFLDCDIMFNAGSFIINERWTIRKGKVAFDAGGTLTSTNAEGGYDKELIWVQYGGVLMFRAMVFNCTATDTIPVRIQLDGIFYGAMSSNTTYNIETYYGGFVFWDDTSYQQKINKRGPALIVAPSA